MDASMRSKLAALFAGLAATFSVSAAPELLNGVSVIVNNEVITEQEIEVALAPLARSLYQQYANQPQLLEQNLRRQRALQVDRLVTSKLILADFKAQGYQLPEVYVEDYIRNQIREEFGDTQTFVKVLKERGQTREQFRQERKDQLIVRMLQRQMVNSDKIVISPTRIENHYRDNLKNYQQGDQVKLRMISINQPAGAPKGMAKKIADEVHTKILDGAPFAQMASVYSDGSARTTGGDRGWIDRNFLNKELTEVAFGLKPGELSPVVDLAGGAYILYVEEVRIDYTRPLAEVQDEIEAELRGQEQERLIKKWIDRLKQKNFVRYF
jgi:parvulin-like peptidyl-prolyl isomerase